MVMVHQVMLILSYKKMAPRTPHIVIVNQTLHIVQDLKTMRKRDMQEVELYHEDSCGHRSFTQPKGAKNGKILTSTSQETCRANPKGVIGNPQALVL